MSISINNNFDNWINIYYSKTFINNLKKYEWILTTNYYVGNLENVEYLHGKIKIENKDIFVHPRNEFNIKLIASKCIQKQIFYLMKII